jgi:transposase
VEEIAAKLAQAKELAARGKTHREISKALGVSVMTYHRWRKSQDAPAAAKHSKAPQARVDAPEARPAKKMGKEIELENQQLRRLVTDLLLEKLKLEEEIRGRREARFRGGR